MAEIVIAIVLNCQSYSNSDKLICQNALLKCYQRGFDSSLRDCIINYNEKELKKRGVK